MIESCTQFSFSTINTLYALSSVIWLIIVESKTETPSTAELENSGYFTPSARMVTARQREIFETPKTGMTRPVSTGDQIPFADRSPETPSMDGVTFRTPMTSWKGLRPVGQGSERWSTPPTIGKKKSPLRQLKMEELERMKEEARERARMKSDWELGIGSFPSSGVAKQGRSQERGPWRLGLCPKPRGGSAARANYLGLCPQTPAGAPPPDPLVNGVWGRAPSATRPRAPLLAAALSVKVRKTAPGNYSPI